MIQIIYHGTVQKEMLKPQYREELILQINETIEKVMQIGGLEYADIHVENSPVLPDTIAQMSVLINVVDIDRTKSTPFKYIKK